MKIITKSPFLTCARVRSDQKAALINRMVKECEITINQDKKGRRHIIRRTKINKQWDTHWLGRRKTHWGFKSCKKCPFYIKRDYLIYLFTFETSHAQKPHISSICQELKPSRELGWIPNGYLFTTHAPYTPWWLVSGHHYHTNTLLQTSFGECDIQLYVYKESRGV